MSDDNLQTSLSDLCHQHSNFLLHRNFLNLLYSHTIIIICYILYITLYIFDPIYILILRLVIKHHRKHELYSLNTHWVGLRESTGVTHN